MDSKRQILSGSPVEDIKKLTWMLITDMKGQTSRTYMSSTYPMPPTAEIDTKDNMVGKTEAHTANCNVSEKSTPKRKGQDVGSTARGAQV